MKSAPGRPGIEPHWTSSFKQGVGTAANAASRVWFTLSHGIVNEVYYPRIDRANTRDFGLLVTAADYFSEEKRQTASTVEWLEPGVPGFRLVNRALDGRYRIEKRVITDPERDVLLQEIVFEPLVGELGDYRLYALLAPHLGNRGYGNNGWLGEYRGQPALFAERDGVALAFTSDVALLTRSCGFVGVNDGWQQLAHHGELVELYDEARDGNIALTAEIDLEANSGRFVLALAFGSHSAEAALRARESLALDFEHVLRQYGDEWRRLQGDCSHLPVLIAASEVGASLVEASIAVLKSHESKSFPGALIASLSIPWGFAKGDDDLGGYHLVWPRDLVESAGGLLAMGNVGAALRSLRYLIATQEADGHWPQNMWLDGTPYWQGVQMDEAAFPILLADTLRRLEVLDGVDAWPMVRRAAGYLLANGPVTQQDRWEEDGGYSPFTLAVEVAALLAAADFARERGEEKAARYLTETADIWNAAIERWTYVSDTALAREVGVDGYYVRIAPPETACAAASPAEGFVPIKNRPPGESSAPAERIISPDALALVRFGLRNADDPRILATVKAIDHLLRCETASGPAWHRYNGDGYGEHADGSPFDGTGIGRAWPLLAGERAHYEVAAGNGERAREILASIERQASPGGMISEQIWDAPDIPDRELVNGYPSGSARPLVWAHAEYLKLVRSIADGAIFDQPPQTAERYRDGLPRPKVTPWRFNNKCHRLAAGDCLRIETLARARVHWSADGWETVNDLNTEASGLGVHWADLPTADLAPGSAVVFTFFWSEAGHWEGRDFRVEVQAPPRRRARRRARVAAPVG